VEKRIESARGQEPALAPAPAKARMAWQPLSYEKLDAAQAQTTTNVTGADGGTYS
jgi:hypothetical protein